jgi:hypothetical protein
VEQRVYACCYRHLITATLDGPSEGISHASYGRGGKLGSGEHGSAERAPSAWVETKDDSIIGQG